MRVTWDKNQRYRAFFEASRGVLSLVSSRLSKDADGVTIDGTLLIVTVDDVFCDLELMLDSRQAVETPFECTAEIVANDHIDTLVPGQSNVRWFYDHGDLLQIRFGEDLPARWISLDDGAVALGLKGDNRLCAIQCSGVVSDPTSALQQAWLEEIEPGF